MAHTKRFSKFALSLEGAISKPHFDRTAFRVHRIFATLAANGLSANFKFDPQEQELKCMVHPKAFAPIDNAWGKQGWTKCQLDHVSDEELHGALEMAWRHAVPKKPLKTL